MNKNNKKNNKKIGLKILYIFIALGILGLVTLIVINTYIKALVSDRLLSDKALCELEDIDCILVLGCGVRQDGTPSLMLSDRLDAAIELYNAGVSQRILMSGDNSSKDYDEVGVMKAYAIEHGVPAEAIYMDHAGFSTYESMYRAKEVFGIEKMVVVTQKYHMYRSLYIAQNLDIEAYGLSNLNDNYSGNTSRELREVLARFKDFFTVIFKPEPTYLGEKIDIYE